MLRDELLLAWWRLTQLPGIGPVAINELRTRLGDPDESGRRRPEAIEGSEWVMDVDIVIEAIGNKAPQESPEWYPNVEVDDNRLVKINPDTGQTSVAGIFAGGDLVRCTRLRKRDRPVLE